MEVLDVASDAIAVCNCVDGPEHAASTIGEGLTDGDSHRLHHRQL